MNLGGVKKDFETKDYEKRLPKEIEALSVDRDIVGLTDINVSWYEWWRDHYSHRFGSAHDGDDCAILWRRDKVQPTNPEVPGRVTRSFTDGEIEEKCWRPIDIIGELFSRSSSKS